MSDTLWTILERAARTDLGVQFVGRNERFVPYAQIAADAARMAGALHGLGVQAGDTVALVLPTGPDFYTAFFGAVRLGAIPVPLYPPQRLGKLDEFHARTAAMLRAVDACIVVTEKRIRRLLGQAIEQARPRLGCMSVSDVHKIMLSDERSAVGHGALPRVAAASTALPPTTGTTALDPDAMALVQFSSGTTVDPKPVALTHRQLLANMHAVSQSILRDLQAGGLDAPIVAVSWLPLYHDMGLIGCVLTSLYEPTKLVLLPPELFVAKPALWLQTISRFRGTVSAAPNFAYSYCAERIRDAEMEGIDLRSWRVALNGAEPITEDAVQRFGARFASYGFRAEAMTPVYGLAEASLAVTFSRPTAPCKTLAVDATVLATDGVATPVDTSAMHRKSDSDALGNRGRTVSLMSLGQVIDGTSLRIVNDRGQPLPPRHCGHLQVRGPSVMRGYYNRQDATQRAIDAEGWLHTGDVGFLHDDELYLTGRSKDLIILRGRNHAPQDIEQHIDAVPGVRTGCSVALGYAPAGSATESLLLLVERQHNGDTDKDAALAEAVRQHVLSACTLAAENVVILDPGTLPRTSSGKLRRQAALAQFCAGRLQAPRKTTAWHLAGAMVRSQLAFQRLGRGTTGTQDER